MTITSSEILSDMAAIRYEPTRLATLINGYLNRMFDGEQMVLDPSMPFPYLEEISILTAYAAISEDQNLDRRQYPETAQTEKDIYMHASDVDYEGNFSSPAGVWFDIYVDEAEIIKYAIQVGDTTTRRLVMPRYTQITVNNMTFTFQYPITFIVKSHGAVDVVYDGSQPSPLQSLEGNKVDWELVTVNITENNKGPVRMIRVRTFVKQMLLTTYKYSLVGSKVLLTTVPLTDSFYYARAFVSNSQNRWSEIKTTHSQQVFDATDPTLLLTVLEGQLTIELPYVYYATGLVQHDIRVDVYTTKGPLNVPLNGMTDNSFVANWRDLDQDSGSIYSAPLSQMSTITVMSTDTISGGADAPSFEVRRQRIQNNATGAQVIPISNAQVGTALAQLGFEASMNIDDISHRTYLATRAMPDNTKGQVTTGIDTAVVTYKSSITDLLTHGTVIDNGERFTVTPKTLYRYIDGVLTIVSDVDLAKLLALSGDALVNAVSDGTYLYTPLHYVLDTSNNTFKARPYFLSAPEITLGSFVASNDTLGLTISASTTRSITRTEEGYVIRIQSVSNDVWKALRDDQVHVQMAYMPPGEKDYAYINGKQILVNGERVFEFIIKSNWDLEVVNVDEHRLITTNFNMFEPIERTYPTPLLNDFSILWSVSDYTVEGIERTEVDQMLGKFLLPDDAVGVYHETLRMHFGDELTGLWAMSRSMIGLRKFLKYEADVYATWESNYYKRDASGKYPVLEEDAEGKKGLVIEFAKGDIKLNADGSKVVQHEKGSAILDEFGNPIMESERNIDRWWDVVLFDGVYRFATDVNDVEYKRDVPQILVEWINDTLGPIRKTTLDETDLFFQPRNTLKFVECLANDSKRITLHTAQFLTLDLYVSKTVYADNDLRTAMQASAITEIVKGLSAISVARDAMETAVRNALGSDLISANLSGLGGAANNFSIITLLDETARLCLAKSMTYQADGTYAVIDGIEVNFKRHTSGE